MRFYSLELNSQMFWVARRLYLDESIHSLCSPILEYASCVWSPFQMGQIKQIESVKISFTSRLLYHTCIDYKTRLIGFGVDSLEIRRLRQDLIYTYKIVFGLVTNAGNEFFTLANSVNVNSRSHLWIVPAPKPHRRAWIFFHWASCARVERSTTWTATI